VVYNIHISGGTFGKSQEMVQKLQEERIEYLKVLNQDLELYKNTQNLQIFIMGDFNYDSNNKIKEESIYSPENVTYKNADLKFYDTWGELH